MIKGGEDCAVGCYVNMTGLIKDGTINKATVKRILENNAYYERQWKKVIEAGVDNCEYQPIDSMTQSLVKFYECVNKYLANNCVSFIQSNECDETEAYFEKCKNIQPNCESWPVNYMYPDSCCKSPLLFTDDVKLKCKVECKRTEFLIMKQFECVNNCTYAGLRTNGKIDFEVVKKILAENSNRAEKWEKPIESSVEICEKVIKGN